MKNRRFVVSSSILNKLIRAWLLFPRNRKYQAISWFSGGLLLAIGEPKLVVTAIAAVTVMLTVYQSDKIDWKTWWLKLSWLITGINRKLFFAVGGGGLVAIASYLILTIWSELDNHWLATVIILQGVTTCTGLGVVIWYLLRQKSFNLESSVNSFDNLILHLTSSSSVQRFWTINQLINLRENNHLNPEQINQLKDYFLLMAKVERNAIVLKKIEDDLLRSFPSSTPEIDLSQPLNIPAHYQAKTSPIQQHQAKIQQIKV